MEKGKKVKLWPYGAILISDGEEEETQELWHISRFDLEDYKELIESAIQARDNWRQKTGNQ